MIADDCFKMFHFFLSRREWSLSESFCHGIKKKWNFPFPTLLIRLCFFVIFSFVWGCCLAQLHFHFLFKINTPSNKFVLQFIAKIDKTEVIPFYRFRPFQVFLLTYWKYLEIGFTKRIKTSREEIGIVKYRVFLHSWIREGEKLLKRCIKLSPALKGNFRLQHLIYDKALKEGTASACKKFKSSIKLFTNHLFFLWWFFAKLSKRLTSVPFIQQTT